MDVSLFIASRLRFKEKVVLSCITVSFLIVIIAVAVSSGFRTEIRNGVSRVTGDVQLALPRLNYLEESSPVNASPTYIDKVLDVDGVESVQPVVYRAGIVKDDSDIFGVMVKGVTDASAEAAGIVLPDSVKLGVSIPSAFAELSGLSVGDRMLAYFIGDRVKVRQFNVAAIYESLVETDGRYLVYADIDDMRRLNGWDDGQASMLEVMLKDGYRDEQTIEAVSDQIGFVMKAYATEDDDVLVSMSSVSRFPQLFDWLGLIDFNVFFILLLMTIVAGFNMISGLLIMLFENISTIGLLKSLGMTDRSIAKVFLASSAVLVLKGMVLGNALAFLFCFIQDKTHILRLDPENYFVSFVPVHIDFGTVFLADAAVFAAIMLLLLIPSLFISRVDPAETVRVR
ncbi:MAG: ABC transporter permease [Bacteroidales bacterium]|nr:ABC transporter permease [Bacteroidales bacterium]